MTSRFYILAQLCVACLVCASIGVAASAPEKSVVEYVKRIPSHVGDWTLYHFQALNDELARFVSRERGLNSKCLVVPDATGYAVVWIRSEHEEPVSEAQRKSADAIIQSYLSGRDFARISKELKEFRR